MIYFQGTEAEASLGSAGTTTTTSFFDTAWSRAATNTGAIIRSPVPLTDFWHASFAAANFTSANTAIATYFSSTDQPIVRVFAYATNLIRIDRWSGSAWVTAIEIAGDHSGMHVIRILVGAAGRIEFYNDGALMGAADLNLSLFANVAYCQIWTELQSGRSQNIIADQSLVLWNLRTASPSADGTDTGGIGGVANVNAAALTDSTWIEFAAAGDRRSFVAAARSLTQMIKGVTASVRAMRVDATGPQRIRPYLLISGVRYFGPSFLLTTGLAPYQHTWETNPATGAAWTNAEANAASLEFGWEAVA